MRFLIARDCLFIGKHAFNKGLYDQAVDWISTAAEVARSENNQSASVSEIKPFLSTAIRVVLICYLIY
jgi:prolyl 4-hydroxylase